MIIRREALQAAMAAVTADDTRYFLNAIQAEPDNNRLVSTNGHVLLIVTDTAPMDDADFPIVAGAEFHGNPDKPVLMPADIVTKMIKAMPKRSTLPILGAAQLARNGSPDTATLASTDLQAPTVATIKPSDATFPQYDRVLVTDEKLGDHVSLCLSVDVLETLCKAARAVQAGVKSTRSNPTTITFDIPTRSTKTKAVEDAVRVSMKGSDVSITGAAMPCRI